jgi:molybdate transport system ATP-binding protein
MSGELAARFEKRYPGGAVIAADLRQPTDGFSVTILFGPSGCGKTTLLRCLAGLERPETGRIEFQGDVWFDASQSLFRTPQQRDIGFLFQEYALFPHLTVAQNIGYGLRRCQADKRRRRTTEIMERFQLGDLAGRYPQQISGGQQQRVALARALVRRPKLLLLDEPLSALDAILREGLRSQLRRLLAEFSIPVLIVTHDRTEAIALGDRIAVMDGGEIRQHDSVETVFSHPRDLAVAKIVGVETIVPGEILAVTDGLATVQVAGKTLLAVAPDESSRQVHVCIKGENVSLQRSLQSETSVRNQLPAVVTWLSPEGPLVRVGLDCGFELSAVITRPAAEELRLQPGDQITACVKTPAIHLIPR